MRPGVPLLWAYLCLAPQGLAQAQTLEDRARNAASAAQTRTGDSDALQGNYLTPGLSGEAISTIDGSRTFNPAISCQRTATMLELLAQPAATGDIAALRITRDKDLDGSFDETLTLPMVVSGVCADGIVSCDPGSWNGCRSFRWNAQDGTLRLDEVGLTQLAACYCVNNSCGTNLVWGNLPAILKDLGGGVIGALTSVDPRIGIAQASIDGPVIRYTGAQTTACVSNPALPQTGYRNNPAALADYAYAASRTNSVFQAIVASPAGIGKSSENRNCTVKRTVTIREVKAEDIIQITSGGYATSSISPGHLTFHMGSPGNDSLSGGNCGLFDFRMTIHVEDAARLSAVRLTSFYADDWAQIRVDGQLVASGPSSWTGTGYPPAACERAATFYAYPNLDLKPWLSAGDHEIWMRVAVADKGEALMTVEAEVDTSCAVSETLSDSCLGNAGDPGCSLADEIVDGVQTFRNGIGTGLTPLPQTRTLGPGACSMTMSRDFWERQRRYQCTASIAPPDLSRSTYIIDHSTETLLADRTLAADGTARTSTRPFAMPDRGAVSSCEHICKTRAPRPNSDVALDGVVGTKQNDPSGWDIYYHSCSASNVCPLGPGEERVSDCGCLDDFPEAVVMMQTLRLGGADLLCTATAR